MCWAALVQTEFGCLEGSLPPPLLTAGDHQAWFVFLAQELYSVHIFVSQFNFGLLNLQHL